MKRSGRAQTAQLRLYAAQTAPQYRVHERSSRARSVAPRPRPVGEGVSEGLSVSRGRAGVSQNLTSENQDMSIRLFIKYASPHRILKYCKSSVNLVAGAPRERTIDPTTHSRRGHATCPHTTQ
jgi:hypothetical protein